MDRRELIQWCEDVVRAEDQASEARDAYEADPHNADLRFAYSHAWRSADRARKRFVREVSARDILNAFGGTESDKREVGTHATLDEVRMFVRLHGLGLTYAQIEHATGRSRQVARGAVEGWLDGTSRLAKRAKEAGTYRRDGKAA